MPTGKISTYDLTVGTKINMDEAIYLLSPTDTPMLNGVGSDGLSVISTLPTDQKRIDFMTDNILTPRSALATGVTTGTTFVTLASDTERLKFSTGDVLRIPKQGVTSAEVLRITGYGVTAGTLLVTRGYEGSTAIDYATGALVIGLGTALPEGSDPEAARSLDRSQLYNITQIFGPTSVDLTGTEQVISKYGVTSEWNHQLMARNWEQAIAREQAYLYGTRTDSTTTEIRTMGGMEWAISTNVDNTSTQLTIVSLTARQQVGYNRGGVFDRIMANPVALGDLNAIEDSNRVRTTFDDPRRGRMPVMEVHTEFGVTLVVRNRWMAPMHAFGFSRENVVRRPLRPVLLERLAKTGDSDKAMIVCEETLEIKGEEHMTKFTNLAYTGSN